MNAWHEMDVADALAARDARSGGLSSAEVQRRLAEFGRNELETVKPPSMWRVWFNQFRSPMIAFLGVCAVITAIKAEWVDTIAIVLVLLLNAIVGFWQERKAESDVRALASMATTTARVLRDGQVRELDAAELVPGDVVRLESGDKVPADVRLLEVTGLRVDESMLTGEAMPVNKNTDAVPRNTAAVDQLGMAFSGTLVVAGRASGVVVATGSATQIGEINELVQGPVGKTPLQVLTSRLERYIAATVLGFAVLITLAGVVIGTPWSEMFRTGVALIVSAIPEALPIVLTVAMGHGVSQMAKRHAVVRRLPSVETLGSTTVIGSDKTGTLTQNRLTVEALWTHSGQAVVNDQQDAALHQLLRAGALTNEARIAPDAQPGYMGDAVDIAMLSAAIDSGAVRAGELDAGIIADQPYEPDNGYSRTLRNENGRLVLYAKGAPEKIVEFCDHIALEAHDDSQSLEAGFPRTEAIDRAAVLEANSALGADGLRVIATAYKVLDAAEADALTAQISSDDAAGGSLPPQIADVDGDGPSQGMVLAGLQAMVDPPRQGVPEAVEQCRQAGIHVMMITGDNPVTAMAIGARLGLDTEYPPITGAELSELDDGSLMGRLETTSIAARMTPKDKLRIVELLQDRGEIVAVTGDGVNDAPALRAAAIGVAMGASGTDVAREAADMVLTDDNFVTIVDAVERGRVTFATIRKATFFLLSSAVAMLIAVAVNTFSPHPLIFAPVMILWMNIVTNGLQDVALAFEPGEGDELQQAPRPRSEGVLNGVMWIRTVITGVVMAVLALTVFDRVLVDGGSLPHARTMAITTMVMASFFQVVNARTERRSVFTVNPLRNPFLMIASVGALIGHWIVTSFTPIAQVLGFVSLSGAEWAMCFGLGATLLFVVEVEKWIRRRFVATP